MRFTIDSVPKRPGRTNEDFAGVVPGAAVVIDGAGIPGTEEICRHGVAWYAHRLGGTLLGLLPLDGSLTTLLAEAIEQVTEAHRDTCDVASPISPSATVALLRVREGTAEHLVLGDTTVVLDRHDAAPLVVTDAREVVISRTYEARLKDVPAGSDDYRRILAELRTHRNQPGGFWLAKDDPRAAAQARTGSCPVAGLRGAALLSNGAGRFVDRFGLSDWPGLLAILTTTGPDEVIRRVREAEAHETVAPDDATIVHCTALR